MRGLGRRILRAGRLVGLGVLIASAAAVPSAETAAPCPTRVVASTLRGADEVPPVITNGVGSVRLTLDASGGVAIGGWGIGEPSSDITAVEIAQAAAGSNGPVVLTFGSVPVRGGSFSTFTTASQSLLASIQADPAGYYVNVRTEFAPQGELRGQLACPAVTTTNIVATTLSGANQSPPNLSTGGGSVQLTLDAGGGTVVGTWTVSGLSSAITAGHIHQGAFGTNGDIVVDFSGLPPSGGSFTTVTTGVSPSLIASILADPRGFYVNVHTGTMPNGEVRGQLGRAGPTTLWSPVVPKTGDPI